MHTLSDTMKLLFKLGIGMIVITIMWLIFSTMYPNVTTRSFLSILDPHDTIVGTTTTTKAPSTKKKRTIDDDWLPAPVNIADILGRPPQVSSTTNVYVSPPPYNGSANVYKPSQQPFSGYTGMYTNSAQTQSSNYNYIEYTSNGTLVQKSDGTTARYDINTGQTIPTGNTSATNEIIQAPNNTKVIEPSTPTIDQIRELYIRNLSLYPKIKISKNFTFTGEAREVMFSKTGSFPLVIIDNLGKVGVIGTAQATDNWAVPGWVRFKATINVTLPKNVTCSLVFESSQIQVSTGKPLRFPYHVTCNG
jgi:hypothetical protein